jgi:hypothetical protein
MAQAAWIWWLGGGVLALAGLALLWWSLFRDRARGRRRCPRCWYDMGGVPGLVCPECGGDAKRERRLGKVRRRWRIAATGVLMLIVAVVMLSYPRCRQSGVLSLVPTDILLFFNPAPGHEYRWDPNIGDSRLDPVAAELMRRIEQGRLSRRHWNRLMQDEGLFLVRPSWPAAETLTIGVALPCWVGAEVAPKLMGVNPGELRMRVMIDGWEEDAVDLAVNNDSFGPRAFRMIEFPDWFLDGERVDLSAALYVRAYDDVLDERIGLPLWRGSIPVAPKLVGEIGEAITPCRDTELNRVVAEMMRLEITCRELPGDRRHFSASIVLDESVTPRLVDLAVGVHVEIRRGDEQVAQFAGTVLPWNLDLRGTTARMLRSDLPELTDRLSPLPAEEELNQWVVRITGDRAAALRDVDKSRCWIGEFERPLREVMRVKQ